jgi:hypothetical protein
VHANSAARKGDVIFSIPLSSCLRDDDPPVWYDCAAATSTTSAAAADESDAEDGGDDGQPCLIAGSYNPSDWASRLAAKVLHARLFCAEGAGGGGGQAEAARRLWLDLLPDPDRLRPTLPVHWSPAVLRSACCTSLELAVDTAFFARARSVDGLAAALASALRSSGSPALRGAGPERLRRLCDDALDVVQTRSCRVAPNRFFPPREAEAGSGRPEAEKVGDGEVGGGGDRAVCEAEWSPPLRVLAPVFDMINHSPRPNAEFFVDVAGEEPDEQSHERLAVRALRDLEPGEQILIDYGVSARPAYRCLASYGFVPAAAAGPGNPEEDDEDDDDVAEVYIDGSRYEVTRSTVPEDIVLAVAPAPSSVGSGSAAAAGAALTPDGAIRLASRLSDVAYQLLLNPLGHESFGDAPRGADGADDEDEDDEDGGRRGTDESPSDVVSARLAASLRWSQHRILLACAMGLRDWAVGGGG